MTVKSADFLQAACECLAQQSEAGYRSCISRAYYAMFHHTQACLLHLPNYSSNHHVNLIGYMTSKSESRNEPFDSHSLKVLGYNLKQLRDARNEADYDLENVTVSEDMAQFGYKCAQLYFTKWADLEASKAS
ncbi:UNVERIFIED_ORG: uncharacterized protein (UPF0332 family) [Pantoea allii]